MDQSGAGLACLQNLNRHRSDAPLHSGGASRHPDIDFPIAPAGVHPIADREDFISIMVGNPDFRAERQAVHGNHAIVNLGARGRGERVTVGLVLGRTIGARPDNEPFLDGLVRDNRQFADRFGIGRHHR